MAEPINPITRLERFVDEIDRRVTDLELADPEERRARAVLRRIARAERRRERAGQKVVAIR